MKIIVINASPKGKGNTDKTVNKVENHFKNYIKKTEFEYIYLKDFDLKFCKGCYVCLKRGEEFCPLKDNRDVLEKKIAECDGLIFASPVYVYNMSYLAKNFVDRFAYRSHRPAFHNKKAFVISTTGAVGLAFTLFCLSFPLKTWGFDIVSKLGVKFPYGNFKSGIIEKMNKKAENDIKKSSRKFYINLINNKIKRPGVFGLIQFYLQKASFGSSSRASADYKYWKSKGWLEKKTKFYYASKVNVFENITALILSSLMLLGIPKNIPEE